VTADGFLITWSCFTHPEQNLGVAPPYDDVGLLNADTGYIVGGGGLILHYRP
jgi:hypothetical protein